MPITDRDRKLLWGRAHNRCAMCREVLTPNSNSSSEEAIIADEAHIIARSPTGPRGGDGDRANIDGYENLVLLCKNHHKAIDDMPWTYPVDRLLQIKAEHEVWAESIFEEREPEKAKPIRVVPTSDESKILFQEASTGAQLWHALSNAVQCNIGYPHSSMGEERVEIANNALATLQEISDVADEIAAGGYRAVAESVKEIDNLLRSLAEVELVLTWRLLPRHIAGGTGLPMAWNVIALVIHTLARIEELRGESPASP